MAVKINQLVGKSGKMKKGNAVNSDMSQKVKKTNAKKKK